MSRLIVLFSQPRTLARDEVAPWVRAQTEGVLGIGDLWVVPLEAATRGGARQWDWMLEAEIQDAEAHKLDGAFRDLLLDLRLLGTRPVAVVALDGEGA